MGPEKHHRGLEAVAALALSERGVEHAAGVTDREAEFLAGFGDPLQLFLGCVAQDAAQTRLCKVCVVSQFEISRSVEPFT